MQASTQTPESLLQGTREASAARKAFEVHGCIRRQGDAGDPPRIPRLLREALDRGRVRDLRAPEPTSDMPRLGARRRATQSAAPSLLPDAVLADGPPPLTGAMLHQARGVSGVDSPGAAAGARARAPADGANRAVAGGRRGRDREAQEWLAAWAQVAASRPSCATTGAKRTRQRSSMPCGPRAVSSRRRSPASTTPSTARSPRVNRHSRLRPRTPPSTCSTSWRPPFAARTQ